MSRRNHLSFVSCLVACSVVLGGLAGGCGPSAYKITPVPPDRTLEESVLIDEGGLAPVKVALIDVSGMLLNQPQKGLFSEGEHPVSMFVEMLDKAAQDRAVKTIVLRINSPGGSVTAADLMYREVLRVRRHAKHPKPVVAVIMDVGASGAYYVACGCDEVVAHPTSIVGSIGVILQTVNFKGTLDKIGVETLAIKSGKHKDAGSPFRGMTDEEKKIFQELIDHFYGEFVRVVATGRPSLTEARVREFADGRVWTAEQAKELGLIDRIGTLRETLVGVKERLKAKSVRVVTYHRPLEWKPTVYAAAPDGGMVNNYSLLNVNSLSLPVSPAPQFLYLWAPGM